MARKINLTWTQPPEQRLAPRAQRHRHAARRNLKRGPVCVISVIGATSQTYRRERFYAWQNNTSRRDNLLHYAGAATYAYQTPWSHQYGGGYLHKVRPLWPSSFAFSVNAPFSETHPFPASVSGGSYGNTEYNAWSDNYIMGGTIRASNIIANSTGVPYWQDHSQWERSRAGYYDGNGVLIQEAEPYPTNYDYFTWDWATFRAKFKDESITDRDVSQVPVYALWSRRHTADETYAQYNWPSVEGTYLKMYEIYITLWDRSWSGHDRTYDNFIMGTNTRLIKRTKHTSWSGPSFQPSADTVDQDALEAQMDYYKISSEKWTHLEYFFNPPLITSGDEASGQAWGDSYNAWDIEVFPQYIKPDTSEWSWAEVGLAKPVSNETVSDWFSLCGFTGEDDPTSGKKGNTIERVLLYIGNDNETINGDDYKLFKEKATDAGLVVKCLTASDEMDYASITSTTHANEYRSEVLGLGRIHKALNAGFFYGTDEGLLEALSSGDFEQYLEENTKLSPGLGFDEFGTKNAAGEKVAEEDESLWLDYPSMPNDPTHEDNRWFRTEAEAADYAG